MRGTPCLVNKAMMRPIMIANVEKRFVLANALISFPLVAATHFHLPAALLGLVFFAILHFLLIPISKYDPMLGQIIKRSTRYLWRSYFPAVSHPNMINHWKIKSLSRPW